MGDTDSSGTSRKECHYGRNCHRKNPAHFVEFAHAALEAVATKINNGDLEEIISEGHDPAFMEQAQCVAELLANGEISRNISDIQTNAGLSDEPLRKKQKLDAVVEKSIHKKIENSAPIRYFLSTVQNVPETHNDPLSLTFSDILDPSLGHLEESLQLNFMVEVGWLLAQYCRHGLQKKKMLIVHGQDTEELQSIPKQVPSITTVRVKPKYPFGSHHTKMAILYYEDKGIRIILHTGNLIESDWEDRTQGLWVSPRCPLKAGNSDGESVTGFKKDILRYLEAYPVPQLKPWIDRIRQCDLSQINVCFIPSIPGSYPAREDNWGHSYLSQLLKKHSDYVTEESNNTWQTIAQCSSIGSLGNGPQDWLQGELGQSMAACQGKLQSSTVKVIFPSYQNVISSIHGILGGGCLPYTSKSHQKQRWFASWLHQWRSDSRNRTRAMPHIKTYTRISSDLKSCAWFVLSSANLSKAAWGMRTKAGALMIQSYEAGVLFLPKFINAQRVFEVGQELKLPYDVPLTKYEPKDEPWFIDHMRV